MEYSMHIFLPVIKMSQSSKCGSTKAQHAELCLVELKIGTVVSTSSDRSFYIISSLLWLISESMLPIIRICVFTIHFMAGTSLHYECYYHYSSRNNIKLSLQFNRKVCRSEWPTIKINSF